MNAVSISQDHELLRPPPLAPKRRQLGSVTTRELSKAMGINHRRLKIDILKHISARYADDASAKQFGISVERFRHGSRVGEQFRMSYESAWNLKDIYGRELKDALGRLKDTESEEAEPMSKAQIDARYPDDRYFLEDFF